MKTHKNTFDQDKQKVLEWLQKNAPDSVHARKRPDILPFIQMPDRYYRLCAAELIKEGHICSHNSRGYWAKPLSLHTYGPNAARREIDAIKECYAERKAKALSTLDHISALYREMEELEQRIFQGQKVFVEGV